ncbi:MAG: type II toxin-antitoxin system VapC family toxin [Deltaproteobacteria bacterium]|nr:type II toxin-antitoxin system VapC family toxin [Deltaproteobacteria bacterium]
MTLLLDTHVWVWSQEQPEKLGQQAARALVSTDDVSAVCTISTLEIARLVAGGAISLAMPLADWITHSLRELDATTLPVSHEIAMEAYALPGPFHRDPADRVLVAAARIHQLVLLTADERLLQYPYVHTMDVRN